MLPTNSPYIGTLGLPKMWQRWFDALRNAKVTKLADQSVMDDEDRPRGTPDPHLMPRTFNPNFQSSWGTPIRSLLRYRSSR